MKQYLHPIIKFLGLTTEQKVEQTRKKLAFKYLLGEGLEIGALHRPLILNSDIIKKIIYVDRLSSEMMRKEYPEMNDRVLVNIDVIDNGEVLSKIEDESLDFIIANHFIEHCENPIGTIRNHLKKIKRGGNLFYAIPNKEKTFDKDRSITSWEHLI